MTNAEIMAYQREEREWEATPAGSAFAKFERLLGSAWITDQREHSSTAAMDRDWKAAKDARAEIVAEIRRLQAEARKVSIVQ